MTSHCAFTLNSVALLRWAGAAVFLMAKDVQYGHSRSLMASRVQDLRIAWLVLQKIEQDLSAGMAKVAVKAVCHPHGLRAMLGPELPQDARQLFFLSSCIDLFM